jgi:hypothetical protein
MIEEEMDACGNEHAAEGRDDGKKGFFKVGQLPDVKLTLYLQPYEKKEYGHEAIVDPVFDAMPEMEPALACARVCQKNGYDGAADQDKATGFFAVEKFPE